METRRERDGDAGQQGRKGRPDGPSVGRERRCARHRRSVAGGRRRRLRGSARPAAASCAQPEGRPGAHFHPGARRAVSGVHRERAKAPAGARRRLSGHGRVARLPQVEAADPQAAGRRRRKRRGTGRRAAVPPEAAGSHARRRGAAGQPQPARPRRVRARHAGTGHRREAQRVFGLALRPADRLCGAAAAQGDHQCPHRQARRLVAQGGARHPDPADRQLRGLDGARPVPGRVPDRPRRARDRARQFLCRDAGTGARGHRRNAAAGSLRAALSARPPAGTEDSRGSS